MRVAVVGAGGVGGYFGGLLARAGHFVAFLARGPHLQALRGRGLTVHSLHGDFDLNPVTATDRPAEIGPVDLILCTVKTYDLAAAAEAMQPLVGSGTAVLPLQNGVEGPTQLAQLLPPETVVGGAVWVVSSVSAPGVIKQESAFRRIVLGELAGGTSPRTEAICAALGEAGAQAEVSPDILKVLWTKLLFIASFSGLTSVTRAPAGVVLASPEARALLQQAMEEVAAAARGIGVAMDGDVVDKTMAFCAALAPSATSSMQRDVVAGRRLEYDAINGAVVRAGQRAGVPTPVHGYFWTCLQVVDAMAQAGQA